MNLKSWLWGRWSGLGAAVASVTFAADQAHKWWMVNVYQVMDKGRVAALPFLDYKYHLNTGISFSMLDGNSYDWQLALTAFAVVAVAALWCWLASGGNSRLIGVGLGLIMGGALGNALDRVLFGGVIDYFLPHAFGVDWPNIFNIADVAIVAGVALLLYDSYVSSRNDAAKSL